MASLALEGSCYLHPLRNTGIFKDKPKSRSSLQLLRAPLKEATYIRIVLVFHHFMLEQIGVDVAISQAPDIFGKRRWTDHNWLPCSQFVCGNECSDRRIRANFVRSQITPSSCTMLQLFSAIIVVLRSAHLDHSTEPNTDSTKASASAWSLKFCTVSWSRLSTSWVILSSVTPAFFHILVFFQYLRVQPRTAQGLSRES